MNEIVREYGAGLFELAAEENCADELLTEEREIKKLLSREYLHFLIDPSVSKEERKNCVRQAFSGVHPYLLNFMLLMTERGLATEIHGSFGEYEKLYYDRYKIVKATATSAFPLTDEQKKRLEEKLAKNTGHRVEVQYVVDKALIGGMRLDYGNHLVEGSVKAKLGEIKEKLAQTVL